jgi:hypothetical protein
MIGIAFCDQEHLFRKPLLYPAELPGRQLSFSMICAIVKGYAAYDTHGPWSCRLADEKREYAPELLRGKPLSLTR